MRLLSLTLAIAIATLAANAQAQTIDDFVNETVPVKQPTNSTSSQLNPFSQPTPPVSSVVPKPTPFPQPSTSPQGNTGRRPPCLSTRSYRPTLKTPSGHELPFGAICRANPQGGALLETVDRGSLAEWLGFRRGDVVRQLNDRDVVNGRHFAQLLSETNGFLQIIAIDGRTGQPMERMCALD